MGLLLHNRPDLQRLRSGDANLTTGFKCRTGSRDEFRIVDALKIIRHAELTSYVFHIKDPVFKSMNITFPCAKGRSLSCHVCQSE